MDSSDVFKMCREALYNNLLVLGLDTKDFQKKCGFSITTDLMIVPNQVAFQYITYYLFTKLDPIKSVEHFKNVWPVLTPKDQAEFRKVSFKWLTALSKENEMSKIPNVVMTMFISPFGKRVCHIFLAFSRFVLEMVHKREHGRNGLIPPYPIASLTSKTMSSSVTLMHRAQMSDLLSELERVKSNAKATGDKFCSSFNVLNDIHYKLKDDKDGLQKDLAETRKEICATMGIPNNSGSKKQMEEVCKSLLKGIRESWQPIQELHQITAKTHNILNFALNSTTTFCLNGEHFHIKVASDLLQIIRTDLQKANVLKVQENSKLNIINLLKLFGFSLPTLSEPLKSLSKDIDSNALALQLSSLQAEITTATNINNRMEYQDMVAVLKNIKEQEVLTSTFTEVPQPVKINGKEYDLQRATPEFSSVSMIRLNNSAENILNISPINWIESLQSDSSSSPALRRRVLIKSVSPTKPMRTTRKQETRAGKIKLHGKTLVPVPHVKPSAKSTITGMPKLYQSVRPKVQEIKSPKNKKLQDSNGISDSNCNSKENVNNNLLRHQVTVSMGLELCSNLEIRQNVKEKFAENTTKCAIENTPEKPLPDLLKKDQQSAAIQDSSEKKFNGMEDDVSCSLPHDYQLDYDMFTSPGLNLTSTFNFPLLNGSNTSNLSMNSENMSFIGNQSFPDCPNFDVSSELDASRLLLDNIEF